MRKVLVIGSGGAGKSTFARRLSQYTGLPLIHLDALYWNAGWVATAKAEWATLVDQLLAGERWVMDGNYGGTLEQRLAACDTVVFLDLPRRTCLWRVVARRVRFHGRSRPDMQRGCPERLTREFLRWVWKYPVERRAAIMHRLSKLDPSRQVFVLWSVAEVESFVHRIPRLPAQQWLAADRRPAIKATSGSVRPPAAEAKGVRHLAEPIPGFGVSS